MAYQTRDDRDAEFYASAVPPMTPETPAADIVERLVIAAHECALIAWSDEAATCLEGSAEITRLRAREAEREDMANVGEALMETMDLNRGHSFLNQWYPADCPSEIVTDLLNALDEANAREAELQRKLDELGATSIAEIDRLATALGEAEGKLEASELVGVVDGWRERALNAERKLDEVVKALNDIRQGSYDGLEVSHHSANTCRLIAVRALASIRGEG